MKNEVLREWRLWLFIHVYFFFYLNICILFTMVDHTLKIKFYFMHRLGSSKNNLKNRWYSFGLIFGEKKNIYKSNLVMQAVLNLPFRHRVVDFFPKSGARKSLLNLNHNSGWVSKNWEDFSEGFFAVKALNDFIVKKRFKSADVLVSGDHRKAMIEYKCSRVGYKVKLFQSFSEELFQTFKRDF